MPRQCWCKRLTMYTSDQQRLDGTLANAARLARSIIPDLESRPLYLVQPSAESMMTREITGTRSGLYFPNLDTALRPQLEKEGRWRGPGVCVVVDAKACYVCERDDCNAERAVF